MDRTGDALMKPARIGVFAPALLALFFMVRPEPNGPTSAPLPSNRHATAPAPLRQVAHDFATPELKERTVVSPDHPEILPPPKRDANPGARTQTPPEESWPGEIMVGPDGVMYRRLSAGNSADRR